MVIVTIAIKVTTSRTETEKAVNAGKKIKPEVAALLPKVALRNVFAE